MTIPEVISTRHALAGVPCRRPQDAADGCRGRGVRVRVTDKQVWTVGRVAAWDGFCLPCGRDDRPLVLTRSGASGLRAWIAGIGDDERTLLLTCRVCGEWQVVPLREQDDPELVVVADEVHAVQEVVAAATITPMTRPAAAPVVPRTVRLPVPRTAATGRTVALHAFAPLDRLPLRTVAHEPSAATSPDVAAVDAARSVLSAARAGQQRTAAPRPARPASPRGHRRGPTPRRPVAARKARPAVVPVAEATSIVLPLDLLSSGHSVLLAAG